GASPEKVEMSVTKPLEQALATTNGLENIQSISQENQSIIIMEFSQTVNMDSAMIEMSGNIDLVKGYLDDSVSSPMFMKLNPDMLPIQVLSVDMDGMDIKELSRYVNEELAPYFERIDGVATVDVSGSVENYVEIVLNQNKIEEINDSILKSVNGKLYKTKKDLDKAKTELTNGKTELENKRDDAYNKLADGSAQLDQGQAQLAAITSDVEKIGGEIKLYEGQVEALKQKATLETQRAALEGQKTNLSTMVTTLQALTATLTLPTAIGDMAISDILAIDPAATLDPAAFAGLQGALASMEQTATLNGLVAQLADGIAKITQGVDTIAATLTSMGVDPAIISANDSTAVAAQVDASRLALKQAEFMKNTLKDTVEKLKQSYAELEKAKMQAVSALTTAQVEINSAQKELDKGVKEFENARDEALKQANIDSLVTQSMISNILQAQNFSMPAGYIKLGEEKITVKVGEKFSDLEQIGELLLVDMKLDGIEPIHLKDVADVAIKDNAQDSFVKINGNDGLMLSFQKSSIASTSAVSKKINKVIAQLTAEKEGLHITSLMDQGIYIGMVIDSVLKNLIYGGLIAFVVLLFFLKDLRPTLVIGFSIPISLMFAIVLMYFSGVTLNIISLSGLALGVGMLVDNSIVVIENTYRLRNLGYSMVDAAVQGAQQVGGAILASTLTTVCVFLPIVFTQGISRQIFTDMGLTIGYSLVASLIVAMTFVPALSSNILTSATEKRSKLFDGLVNWYEKALRYNLKHKWIVIGLTTALLAVAAYKTLTMPMAFIPPMDSPQMQMTLSLPKETSRQELIDASQEVAKIVGEIEDVETVAVMDGGSMMSAGSDKTKDMSFYVVLKEDKTLDNNGVANLIREKTPQYKDKLTVTTDSMNMSALGGSGISIAIKGNDLDQLQKVSTDMSRVLMGVEGVKSTKDGSDGTLEELRIDVN
ncbi:MAG: efflux RND transporter permease subunit, partial [Oscillospiraceae bacterium]